LSTIPVKYLWRRGRKKGFQKKGMVNPTISAKTEKTTHIICPPIVDFPASGGMRDKKVRLRLGKIKIANSQFSKDI